MFEKFSVLNVDAAGRGGEYTVQVCHSLPLHSHSHLTTTFIHRLALGGQMALRCGLLGNTGSFSSLQNVQRLFQTTQLRLRGRATWREEMRNVG